MQSQKIKKNKKKSIPRFFPELKHCIINENPSVQYQINENQTACPYLDTTENKILFHTELSLKHL